jgi:hypothetical protein
MDGIFVDACVWQQWTRIAVVEIVGGSVVSRVSIISDERQSCAAEIEAIRVGQLLHPGRVIHSDCKGAVEVSSENVTWISRKLNRFAHRAAQIRIRKSRVGVQVDERGVKLSKLFRGLKKKGAGRGVLSR